ncbi:hypothetical protein ABC766_29310 [Methylobacterium fujisawaense]|uniref:hypothetical protein n=1 Tax=Methylobacterium fujisawaense TaxID=107400 RepID=UPI0031F4E88B
MAYTFKDHGTWSEYVPDPMPDWTKLAGGQVIFLRRDSDGIDWYAYRNADDTFQAGSVLANTIKDPTAGREVIKAVFRDPSMIFPVGQRLIEIFGVEPTDQKPHNLFAEMVFDPATHTLSDQPPQPIMSVRDYQFAGQAAAEGIISDDDAMAWVANGKTPQKLIDAVTASVPDPDRRKRVLLFLAGTTIFPRNHELTPILAASFGKDTGAKLDAFFQAASDR